MGREIFDKNDEFFAKGNGEGVEKINYNIEGRKQDLLDIINDPQSTVKMKQYAQNSLNDLIKKD